MKYYLYIFILSILSAEFPIPQIPYNPENYICYRANNEIVFDGIVNEDDWNKAEWTQPFVDIQGNLKPKPYNNTQVKMLWDDEYFYFSALMEENHLWATLTERDAVIFHDNDFEIFLDPDGDTHNYYELEVNAFNTIWDLLLLKPYRDQGRVAVDSWDIAGLKSAIHLNGTLNDPSDIDKSWSVEIGIPWKVLEECANNYHPKNGEQWRVNFSRVHYDLDIVDGEYKKQNKPEYNWVWSPQGLIAMHYPEMWGIVQFSEKKVGNNNMEFKWNELEDSKWYFRQLYYSQKVFHDKNKKWNSNLPQLNMPLPQNRNFIEIPQITITKRGYEISAIHKTGNLITITEDGLIKVSPID